MKPMATVIIIFLLLLALTHLFRLVFAVEMIVNGTVVPVWFSLPALILPLLLAWLLWREQKRQFDSGSISHNPPVGNNLRTREKQMKVIADLTVVPIGVGVSLSKYVAACEKILGEAGLQTRLHAYGTNIEGEWDVVFAAVKRCHEMIHEMGAPRVSTAIKVGTRIDRDQTMDDKVKSVESKLE